MKKIISVIMAAVLLSAAVSGYSAGFEKEDILSVSAEETKLYDKYLSYEINNGEVKILKCNKGREGAVVIPEKIENCPVTSIGKSCFYNCFFVTSISLPETVETIESFAFDGCEEIRSFRIPSRVKVLNERVFSRCVSLESVTMPDGLTEICESVFYKCSSLEKCIVPDGVKCLGDGAFRYCQKLIEIKLPSCLEEIGAYAFERCSSLSEIVIPDSVTYISSGAFYNCSNLRNLVIESTDIRIIDQSVGFVYGSENEPYVISDVLTVSGHRRSPIQEYCSRYGIRFSCLDIFDEGDINEDGLVDCTDVVEMKKYLLCCEGSKKIQFSVSDLNYDKEINVIDLFYLKKMILGI